MGKRCVVKRKIPQTRVGLGKAESLYHRVVGRPNHEKISTSDVCSMLQASRVFLNRLVKAGRLKNHKIGRRIRISREDVLAPHPGRREV